MGDRKEYYRERYQLDGKAKRKAKYEENRAEILEQRKQYRRDNIDKVREYWREYQQRNREKLLEYGKEYRRMRRDVERSDGYDDPPEILSDYELEIQKVELLPCTIFTNEFKDNKIKEIKLKYGIE